jgi:hypothetical protein
VEKSSKMKFFIIAALCFVWLAELKADESEGEVNARFFPVKFAGASF